MNLCINLVDDRPQIFGVIHKIDVVYIDNQQISLFIIMYPGFVAFIQAAEVIDGNGILVFPSPFMNLVH